MDDMPREVPPKDWPKVFAVVRQNHRYSLQDKYSSSPREHPWAVCPLCIRGVCICMSRAMFRSVVVISGGNQIILESGTHTPVPPHLPGPLEHSLTVFIFSSGLEQEGPELHQCHWCCRPRCRYLYVPASDPLKVSAYSRKVSQFHSPPNLGNLKTCRVQHILLICKPESGPALKVTAYKFPSYVSISRHDFTKRFR